MTPAKQLAQRDVSKNRKAWKREFAAAERRLAPLDGTLDWSDVSYEAMRWVHPRLTLIFYQHRTSAGNYHLRVRAAQGDDRKILRQAIHLLAENSCTFQFPTEPEFHREGVTLAVKEGRGFA